MSISVFSKKPVKKVGVVLDIGSKTVGGAIFEKDADGGTKLLYTARESIIFKKVITGESLFGAMLRSLELVLIHLEKYGLEHFARASKFHYHVDTVAGVVSSPWHVSETKNLKLSQEKPFAVTEALVENLLAKEEKSFMEELSDGDHREPSLDFLEHKIIEMKLNGYVTANPYGKKVNQLELNLFTSFAPKQILAKIRASVQKYFPAPHLEFHTFSLAAFASIRDFFPNLEHFLVVQIGGEVTDITIVKKGLIADAVSFPLGYNNLLRALDLICGNHPNCSLEALLALHREAKINSVDKKKVESAIADAKTSWLELFNTAISNFSAETFLPQTVFLFEDSLCAPIFQEFFKSAESGQFTVTAEPFIIKTTADFGAIFTDVDTKHSTDDIVLSMEANFAARFVHER